MEAFPVPHGDKSWLAQVVYSRSVLFGEISAVVNWRAAILRLVVLHKHIALLVRVKEPEFGGPGWFVGMGKGFFVPENGCASAEENRLADKQSRPPKLLLFHNLC